MAKDVKGDHISSDSGVHVSSVTLPSMKRRTAATHTHTGRMENHRGGWGVGGAFFSALLPGSFMGFELSAFDL